MFFLIYWGEVAWFYLLPFIIGCLVALYAFTKPFPRQILKKSMDGLKNGILFTLFSILYILLLSFVVLHSPFPRPDFMVDNFYLDFILDVVITFTIGFGFFAGIAGATLEGIFINWKTKLKQAA
jgi:hypothetical protein